MLCKVPHDVVAILGEQGGHAACGAAQAVPVALAHPSGEREVSINASLMKCEIMPSRAHVDRHFFFIIFSVGHERKRA